MSDTENNQTISSDVRSQGTLVLANLSSCIIMATVISNTVCADQLFTSKLFATTAVMSGLTTVAQTLVGARLPIFQGPTLLGVLPYLDAKDDARWRCRLNLTELYLSGNDTKISPDEQAWDTMWSKVQGSMLIAAVIEAALGLSGLVGFISKLIRPISITVMFVLLGVYLWELAVGIGMVHWGVSFGSFSLTIILAFYLNWLKVPIPTWSKESGWRRTPFSLFELFPIILVIIIMWALCHVITVMGGFSDDPTAPDYATRTDIHIDNIRHAPVFRIPYPGQFGGIDFDLNYIIFYIPCMMASMIESIADYYQYAVACQSPSPPTHAVNRGIAIEGIGAMVSAWLGAGHPTTSYSNMMGIICITKVASRRVMVVSGLILIVIAIIGPLGAVLVSIPTPVMFGPLVLSISLLVGSGFYNLQTVDLSRRRNQIILGLAVYVGVVISSYLRHTKNAIHTSSQLFNDVATGIFKIPFITGGIIAVFLDATLAGRKPDPTEDVPINSINTVIYDPPFVGRWMRRHKIFKYIPFLPGPSTNQDDISKSIEINVSSLDIKCSNV